MITIEKNIVNELEKGNFKEVQLDFWFGNHAFKYIFAVIEGCDKNLDFDMLNFISMYAQYLLVKPNAKVWEQEGLRELIENSGSYPCNIDRMTYDELVAYWNKRIVYTCERILNKVVLVGNKHYEYYGSILEQLSTNSNDNVRLYCCANLNYPNKFLNDPSPRVAKVANIRYQFNQKWDRLNDNDNEKQRIKFLTAALEKNVIQCWDGDVGYKEEDKVYAIFRSILLKGEIWQPEFDKDIFYTIQDKRILADTLNELIKEEKISFKDGMKPSCFEETKRGPVLKKNK